MAHGFWTVTFFVVGVRGATLPGMRMQFADFLVDLETGELLRNGKKRRLADKPFRILEALLERPGEIVGREDLRSRLWPDATFVNFDNNLNTAVNKLREALSDSADAPRFIETIPKRGYRLMVPARSLVEARPRPFRAAKRVAVVIISTIALAVWLWSSSRNEPNGRIRLAVLPFENFTGDPNRDFVTDGLTEELIGRLAHIDPNALGVIARTSSMQYKGAGRDIAEIADELSVDYLFEGSVRQQGDRIRVNAHLIAASDQTQVWAEVYEGDPADVFRIQEAVSESVAAALSLELVSKPVIRITTREARELYLKARYLTNQGGLEDLNASVPLLERALQLDPDYVPAWVALADTYRLMPVPPRERFPKVKQAALRAAELEPASAEAHMWLGVAQYYYDWDWETARASFERALELSPGTAEIHHEYASYLASLGRHEESLAAIRRAQELDPVSVAVSADLGWYFYVARRYEDAIAACLEALELDPDHDAARAYLVLSHFGNGEPDKALAATDTGLPTIDAYWRHRIAELERRRTSGRYVSPTAIARYYAALGQPARTHELLELAFDEHAGTLVFLRAYPLLDAVRHDERVLQIESEVGIPRTAELAVSR